VINLASEVFRFTSLHIDQPIRLIGQAGTIFEVDGGSIFIDFGNSTNDTEDVDPTSRKGTPLTIKKSRVAMISEIEIVFNRTKASLYQLAQLSPEELKDFS
jgi:hypothetical protein